MKLIKFVMAALIAAFLFVLLFETALRVVGSLNHSKPDYIVVCEGNSKLDSSGVCWHND